MILFVSGADTYRSTAHLHKLIKKFKRDRDPQGLNVVTIDCSRVKTADIKAELATPPFLAEKRMIVLKRPIEHGDDALLEYLHEKTAADSFLSDIALVIWEAGEKYKKKKQKELFALLEKQQYAQRFDTLEGAGLKQWIQNECKERKISIDRDAVDYLAAHIGSDTWRLSHVLNQVGAYAGGKPAGLADVQLFVSEKIDDNIFTLVDAIVAGASKDTFVRLYEQYRQGNDSHYVFAMLVRQFRILLSLRDIIDREGVQAASASAARLGVHPFVLKKSMPLAQKFPPGVLEKIYASLLDMDVQVKKGTGDLRQLLDVFVAKMGLLQEKR